MRTRDEQIEKIIEVMKNYTLLHTYGDDGHGYPLVDALTPDGKTIDVGQSECGELAAELYDSVIAPYILEAERRAEQRVRAEIGRDSERLDWLEKTSVNDEDLNIHCLMNTDGRTSFGVCGTGNYEETLRQAIDAAREVG